MASIIIHCPRYQYAQVNYHGQNPTGYAAGTATTDFRPLTHIRFIDKKQSTEMASSGAGERDSVWMLKVSIRTLIQTLPNARHDEHHLLR